MDFSAAAPLAPHMPPPEGESARERRGGQRAGCSLCECRFNDVLRGLFLQHRGYLSAVAGSMTDRPDPLLANPRPTEPARSGPHRDPLSDVLRTVRLRGAVFFMLESSSPWATGMADGETLAPILVPEAQQV